MFTDESHVGNVHSITQRLVGLILWCYNCHAYTCSVIQHSCAPTCTNTCYEIFSAETSQDTTDPCIWPAKFMANG